MVKETRLTTLVKEDERRYFEEAISSFRRHIGQPETICPACGSKINPESDIEFFVDNKIVKVSCNNCSTQAMYEIKYFKIIEKGKLVKDKDGKEGDTSTLIKNNLSVVKYLASRLLTYTLKENYIFLGVFLKILKTTGSKDKKKIEVMAEGPEAHHFMSKNTSENKISSEFDSFVSHRKSDVVFAICAKVINLETSSYQDIVATKVYSIEKELLKRLCKEKKTNYSELLRKTIHLIITDFGFRKHLFNILEDKKETKTKSQSKELSTNSNQKRKEPA